MALLLVVLLLKIGNLKSWWKGRHAWHASEIHGERHRWHDTNWHIVRVGRALSVVSIHSAIVVSISVVFTSSECARRLWSTSSTTISSDTATHGCEAVSLCMQG